MTLTDRVTRALEEPLLCEVRAPGLYQVVPVDGGAHDDELGYTVDVREGRCSCPDQQYGDAPACKHEIRARAMHEARRVRDEPRFGRGIALQDDSPAVATDGGTTAAADGDGQRDDTPDDMAAYTLFELKGYLEEFAAGEFGELRVHREDGDAYAARVEVDDQRLRFELEGAGFRTVRVDEVDTEFYVQARDEPFEHSYVDSVEGER